MARKHAEEYFYEHLRAIAPGTRNIEIYKETFNNMTDEEFHNVYLRVKSGKLILPVYFENFEDQVDLDRVMALGEKMGYNWYQRLRLTDHHTGDVDLTPKKYPVMMLFGRRQIQHLRDKIAAPSTDEHTNHLTGQATGKSKGASITAPELQSLDDRDLPNVIEDLVKNRGGDAEAYLETVRSLEETGEVSLEATRALGSKPKVSETLHALLLGLQLDSTVGK